MSWLNYVPTNKTLETFQSVVKRFLDYYEKYARRSTGQDLSTVVNMLRTVKAEFIYSKTLPSETLISQVMPILQSELTAIYNKRPHDAGTACESLYLEIKNDLNTLTTSLGDDIAAYRKLMEVEQRIDDNGAESKSSSPHHIPVAIKNDFKILPVEDIDVMINLINVPPYRATWLNKMNVTAQTMYLKFPNAMQFSRDCMVVSASLLLAFATEVGFKKSGMALVECSDDPSLTMTNDYRTALTLTIALVGTVVSGAVASKVIPTPKCFSQFFSRTSKQPDEYKALPGDDIEAQNKTAPAVKM